MAQQQQQAASLQYVHLVQSHSNGIPFYQSSQQLQLQPSIVHLQSFPPLNTIPIMSQTTAQAAIPVAKPGRPQLTTGQLPIRPTPTASTASSRTMLPTQAFPQQAVVVNTMGSQQQTLALGNQLFTVNKTQKNLIQPRPTLTTIPTSGQFIGRGTTPQIISQQSFVSPMFQPTVQTFNPQLTYAQAAQPSFINNLNHFQYLAPTQGLQTIPINTLQNNLQVATAAPPATATAQTNSTITSVAQGNTPTNSTVTKLKPVAPRPATTTSSASIGTQAVASSTKLVSSTGTKKQSTIKSLTGGVGVSSTATSSTKSTISDKKTSQDNKTSGTNTNRATSSTAVKASSEVVARVAMSSTQNGVKPTPTARDPRTSTPISKGVLLPPPHLKGDVRKSTPTSSRSIEKRDVSTGHDPSGTRANSHPLSHQSHSNNLRNGIRPQSTINSRAGVKIDKPSKPDQILVHVIEDFIIEESSKPFPINGMDSSIKENGGWVNSCSSTATSTVVSSPTPETSRKRGAVLDNEGECQICLKVGPKARLKLKNALKVCPACASKKVPVPTASSSRLGVFNPVTSRGDKVSEYDFPDQESINISGVKQEQLPDRKKPRLTKTTRASSTTTNVQLPKIDSVSSGGVLSNGATPHVVPDSQSQPQKNDILAGLYIPASGMNPVKWNVQDVYDFIRHLEGCEDAANEFRSQEIDGQALMLLKEGHLITEMHIKIGPALKICSKINELKEATGKTST